VIQFVQTKRPHCFHELKHKLLAAPRRPTPLYVCFHPKVDDFLGALNRLNSETASNV
jgi:hypothetical protein